MEFSIDTPVSQMESIIGAYAQAGVRPLLLAGFEGRIPSTAEAQNLASWAAAFGPGGSFWQGKSYPASAAVTDIEFGNETSYSYQFAETSSASNWYALPSYAARAQTYALRFKDAADRDPGCQPERRAAGSGRRRRQRHADVGRTTCSPPSPTSPSRVAGWTMHPYGPHWEATHQPTRRSAPPPRRAARDDPDLRDRVAASPATTAAACRKTSASTSA